MNKPMKNNVKKVMKFAGAFTALVAAVVVAKKLMNVLKQSNDGEQK
jgi:hypothetical protein